MRKILAIFNKENIETTKNRFEVIALILVAAFFMYKMFDGWLVVNMEVIPSLDRVTGVSKDYLSVNVILKKKDRAAIKINHIKMIVVDFNSGQRIGGVHLFDGVNKLIKKASGHIWEEDKAAMIRMAPNSQMEFSKYISIPKDIPVKVDISVMATRNFWFRMGQWRVSKISLPLKESESNLANLVDAKSRPAD